MEPFSQDVTMKHVEKIIGFGPIHAMARMGYFEVLNAKSVNFEDELRMHVLPLRRKERRGDGWKVMNMTLIIRKNPVKFDVVDGGDHSGEQHLFENKSEKAAVEWIEKMIKELKE